MTAIGVLAASTITLIALVATALTAAADASVRLLGRGRIRRLAEAGVRGSAGLDRLSERPGRVGAAHALVSGASFATVSACGVLLLSTSWEAGPGWAVVAVSAIISTVAVFALGEALPRALAAANPEGTGLAAAPVAARLVLVAYPVARVLSVLWRRLVSLVTGEHSSEVPWVDTDETHASEETSASGQSSDELRDAVEDLGSKIVREVMVPRTDMVCLEDTADIDDAIGAITGAGVSRVPVFHDTVDDIRGVLYAKDLLRCLGDGECSRRVTDHMREALFIPETKSVEELLREMRRRAHIAIVLDEYGGTAGLVTIEDLVEEIVGEIYDEYDQEVQMVTDLGDGRYRIDARTSVDDLNELLGTAMDLEADTAGGLFSELAGHIPEVGESVEVEGLRITVAAKEGNRVRELVIEPASRTSIGEDPS